MNPPHLSFACELDRARLLELFADGSVVDDLRALHARVMIMVSDLSDDRASAVRHLNQAGIPVVGIPLFPEPAGYYFTVDNAERAEGQYEQWKTWSAAHELRWDWVGLDIEPDARFYEQIMQDPRRLPAMLLPRLRDRERPAQARRIYTRLVQRIHRDGWQVENYQSLMRLIRRLERTSRPLLRVSFNRRFSNRVFGLLVLAWIRRRVLRARFTGLDTLAALGVVLLGLSVLLLDSLIALVAAPVGIAAVVVEITLGSLAFYGPGSCF